MFLIISLAFVVRMKERSRWKLVEIEHVHDLSPLAFFLEGAAKLLGRMTDASFEAMPEKALSMLL
jgi:hypothetical protein